MEEIPVDFEPKLGRAVMGAQLLDFLPETGRMVHFLQVRQLVENDVVANGIGSLDEPPIEGDGALAGAGTPAEALVADGDVLEGQLPGGGKGGDPVRQFPCSHGSQMLFDGRTKVGRGIGDQERFGAELDAAICEFDGDEAAAKVDLGADPPSCGEMGAGVDPFQMFFEPAKVVVEEGLGGDAAASARDGEAHGAVRLDPEPIVAGARVADHQQRNGAGPHLQRFDAARRRDGLEEHGDSKSHGTAVGKCGLENRPWREAGRTFAGGIGKNSTSSIQGLAHNDATTFALNWKNGLAKTYVDEETIRPASAFRNNSTFDIILYTYLILCDIFWRQSKLRAIERWLEKEKISKWCLPRELRKRLPVLLPFFLFGGKFPSCDVTAFISMTCDQIKE